MTYLRLIALLFFTSACGSDQPQSTLQSQITGSANLTPILGGGYNSITGSFTGNTCVTQIGSPKTHKYGKTTLTYERNTSFSSLIEKLGIGVELGVRVHPLIKIRGEVQYAQDNAASSLDETYSIYSKTVKQRQELTAPMLNPDFYELATKRRDNIGNRIRPSASELCGDEYVQAVDRGINVFATLAARFDNHYDYAEWKGKIGVTLAEIFTVDAAQLQKVSKNIRQRTRVTLSVLQQGGRPEQLLSVLHGSNEIAHSGMISCTIDNFKPCKKAYDAVVTYMSKMHENNQGDETLLYPISYQTEGYRETAFAQLYDASYQPEDTKSHYQTSLGFVKELQSGIPDLGSGRAKETFRMGKIRLEELIATHRDYLRIASAIASREANYEGSDRMIIYQNNFDAIKMNLQQLESAYADCMTHPQRCESSTDSALASLKDIRSDLLYTTPKNFGEWCLAMQNGTGDGNDRHAVGAIINFASARYNINPNDCSALENALNTTKMITIPKEESIRSLLPFTSLPKLEHLGLAGNSIDDIAPLQDMVRLEAIDLSGNLIKDIRPLQYTQDRLSVVNLSNNEIEGDISNMKRRVHIAELFLQSNQITKLSNMQNFAKFIMTYGNEGLDLSECKNCYPSEVPFAFPK